MLAREAEVAGSEVEGWEIVELGVSLLGIEAELAGSKGEGREWVEAGVSVLGWEREAPSSEVEGLELANREVDGAGSGVEAAGRGVDVVGKEVAGRGGPLPGSPNWVCGVGSNGQGVANREVGTCSIDWTWATAAAVDSEAPGEVEFGGEGT